MSQGKLDDGENHADAGSVISGVLNALDLPNSAEPSEDRPLLVGAARNLKQPGASEHRRAWQTKLSKKTGSWFRPDEPFTPELLVSWLNQTR